MGSVAVPMVRGKNNQGILPQILPVDFIDYDPNLGIDSFYESAICIALNSPVVGTVVHARVESVPESLFIA